MLTFVCCYCKKMSETRRALGSLCSVVNVGGADALRRRVGPEQSPVQRQITRMYQRREEAWRPLNKYRVAAFLRLFFLCFVEVENGLPLHPVTYKMLQKTLITRIIPFICRRLVYTMDETFWIISLPHFKELDHYLINHLPGVHAGQRWQDIAYFFQEVEKQRKVEEEEEESSEEDEEEDAGATNYEQYRQIEPYYRDRDIC